MSTHLGADGDSENFKVSDQSQDHREEDSRQPNHTTSFRTRGFAVLQSALSAGEVADLADAARRILASAGPTGGAGCTLHNILTARPTESGPIAGRLSLHVEHVFRVAPRFRALIQDPRLADPASEISEAPLLLLDDQLYWKPAHTGGATYVHRDSDFFGSLRVGYRWSTLTSPTAASGSSLRATCREPRHRVCGDGRSRHPAATPVPARLTSSTRRTGTPRDSNRYACRSATRC